MMFDRSVSEDDLRIGRHCQTVYQLNPSQAMGYEGLSTWEVRKPVK